MRTPFRQCVDVALFLLLTLRMPLREFADALGHVWQVWDTYPDITDAPLNKHSIFLEYTAFQQPQAARQQRVVRPEYEDGWLTFKYRNDWRRLAPIPAEWELVDDATLRNYLDSASHSS